MARDGSYDPRVGLPRVNLLPKAIREQRLVRRQRGGVAVAFAVLLALLGLWYVRESQKLTDARQEADRERAVAAGLRARKAELQPYAVLESQIAAAEQLRAKVCAHEIRFSSILQDVSAIIPDDVWLTQMDVSLRDTAQAGAGGAASGGSPEAAATPGSPGADSPVATITFTGAGLEHVDVGGFMRALAAGPKKHGSRVYLNPYFTASQKDAKEGGKDTVTLLRHGRPEQGGLLRPLPARRAARDGDPMTRRTELLAATAGRHPGAGGRHAAADPPEAAGHRRGTGRPQQRHGREPGAAGPGARAGGGEGQAVKAEAGELRAEAELAKAEFPSSPNLPALVDALQDAAGEAGVDLVSITPATPKASTALPELAEIATGVNVKGGYFEIEDFLSRVENLVKGADPRRVPPRSVLVRKVSVTAGSDDSGTGDSAAATPDASASAKELQATIDLTVFQLTAPPATPAPAAGAAAAGGTQ